MAFKQNVNIPLVLAVGLVSVMLLVVIVLGTQAWFLADEQAELADKSINAPKSEWVVLKEQQAASIEKTAWTDASHQAVTIPIETAMQIMVQTNGKLPTTQPAQ